MKRIVAIAALALLAGCKPSTSPRIVLDNDFTPDEVEALMNGADEWQSHAELGFNFRYLSTDHAELVSRSLVTNFDTVYVVKMRNTADCPFGDIRPDEWATPTHVGHAGYTIGFKLSSARGMCINRPGFPTLQKLADGFAHEIGHVYGLEHTAQTDVSVMTPKQSVGVQDTDVERMAAQF